MRAVFLDRDGVINKKAPNGRYITSWQEFEFLPGVAEAIRRLNQHGFKVIVVSNQRGIARGMMSEEELLEIHRRMLAELERSAARIDAIYYCPHDQGECRCRKPEVGLFRAAEGDFPGIAWEESFLIGDSWEDMEASRRLGCKGVLIRHGEEGSSRTPWHEASPIEGVAGSLLEAVTRYVIPAAAHSEP